MLQGPRVWLDRTSYVDTMSQKPGLAMDFMTCERTIAAANAQIHIHNQQIGSISDSGRKLLGRSGNTPLVCWWVWRFVIRR